MRFSFNKSIGSLLLAIWLILTGLAHFVPAIAGLAVVLAILAIVAGLTAIMAPDAVVHLPPLPDITGIDAYRAAIADLRDALPSHRRRTARTHPR